MFENVLKENVVIVAGFWTLPQQCLDDYINYMPDCIILYIGNTCVA